jgi:threonine synthase
MNQLICKKCKANYSLSDPRWRCDCGSVLDVDFEPVFDIEKIKKRKPTLWRYREAIPVENDAHIVSFDEGFTPLAEIDFYGRPVFIKQDYLFPTGSFKDRGASVLISKVREMGVKKVVEDSSGNAGAAIAGYCAKAEIDCEIFVPENAAAGKLAQIQLYGATLNKISGTREDTARAVMKAAEKNYYASHSWNPFFFQGTKTLSFEVCEQLGWKSPDTVVLPVGNGALLLGAYIGFKELLNTGIIKKIPKIIAVQSANCAPLYRAFKENSERIPKIDKKDTLAEGIAVAEPIRGGQIIEAVKETKGDFIAVEESEIKESLKEICKRGYYIEPTSASVIAAIKRYLQGSVSDEMIVSVFTGHGLKATEKMLKILNE